MMDVAMEGIRPIEKPMAKYLKTEVFDEVDTLGKNFLLRSPKFYKNLGDWSIKKTDILDEPKSYKRKLDFSKDKSKQHLTISYEQQKKLENAKWEMSGLDFTLSDGNTIVSLQKNNEGKLVVTRRDKTGKSLPGSENLSPREYIEISNFPVKLLRDRIVNAIVDTVDPDKITRYVLPVASVVSFGAHMALSHFSPLNNLADVNKALIDRPALAQTVDKIIPTNKLNYSEIPNTATDFVTLDQENENKYKDTIELYTHYNNENKRTSYDSAVGLIDNLKLVHEFTLPNTKGLTQKKAIEKFLMEAEIPGGELFRYRGRETNGLPQSLKDAISKIDSGGSPYSEDTIYSLIKALREFNGIKFATPKDILQQAGSQSNDLRSAYQETKDPTTGIPKFNDGPIQASEVVETVAPGNILITKDNQYGIVMAKRNDESGNLVFTVWRYDVSTGLVVIEDFLADEFALNIGY